MSVTCKCAMKYGVCVVVWLCQHFTWNSASALEKLHEEKRSGRDTERMQKNLTAFLFIWEGRAGIR